MLIFFAKSLDLDQCPSFALRASPGPSLKGSSSLAIPFPIPVLVYEQEHTMVPFAISGKMLYKDQQVTLICTQKLTFLSRSLSLPKQWL